MSEESKDDELSPQEELSLPEEEAYDTHEQEEQFMVMDDILSPSNLGCLL